MQKPVFASLTDFNIKNQAECVFTPHSFWTRFWRFYPFMLFAGADNSHIRLPFVINLFYYNATLYKKQSRLRFCHNDILNGSVL